MMRTHDMTVLNEKGWKVLYCEKHYGPYPTRGVALTAARSAALKAVALGDEATVAIMDKTGERHVEWTSVAPKLQKAG